VHPLRLLLDGLPVVLVEPAEVSRTRRAAPGWRFLADTRDEATEERLDALDGPYRLFRCHSIMNCVEVCPEGLEPDEGDRPHQGPDAQEGDLTGMAGAGTPLAELNRLRWHCRRGMLELDLLLEGFLDEGYTDLDDDGRRLFARLLDFPTRS